MTIVIDFLKAAALAICFHLLYRRESLLNKLQELVDAEFIIINAEELDDKEPGVEDDAASNNFERDLATNGNDEEPSRDNEENEDSHLENREDYAEENENNNHLGGNEGGDFDDDEEDYAGENKDRDIDDDNNHTSNGEADSDDDDDYVEKHKSGRTLYFSTDKKRGITETKIEDLCDILEVNNKAHVNVMPREDCRCILRHVKEGFFKKHTFHVGLEPVPNLNFGKFSVGSG